MTISLRIKFFVIMIVLGYSGAALSEELAQLPSRLSVADNIKQMDTNKDGMVTTEELRAHLQSLKGKGYKSKVLDSMAASMDSHSCNSSFSKSFY